MNSPMRQIILHRPRPEKRGVPSPALGKHWKHTEAYKQKKRIERLKWLETHPAPCGKNNPNWRGGLTLENKKRLLNNRWKKIRGDVLSLYEYKCCECGKNENLHVHHILPYRLGGRDDIDNLIVLCKFCHGKIEKHNYEMIIAINKYCDSRCNLEINTPCPDKCSLKFFKIPSHAKKAWMGQPQRSK